jgi:hypothetical protein
MGTDNQVMVNYILCLDSIFNEDGMTHSIVDDVVHDVEVADSMDSHCSVVSLVDCITFYERFGNCSNNMEMDWVSAEFESLADVVKFRVKDPSNARFIFGVMDHDMRAVLVFSRRLRVSLVLHISCQ